jgi:hypothetical protein
MLNYYFLKISMELGNGGRRTENWRELLGVPGHEGVIEGAHGR